MKNGDQLRYSLLTIRYSLGWILSLRFAPFRMTTAKVLSLYRILHKFLVIPSETKESNTVKSEESYTTIRIIDS